MIQIASKSPKYFERLHRDEANLVPSDHFCNEFSSDLTLIPPKWRENVINCRKCKRALVCFLSSYFTEKVKYRLTHTQRFVTAGGLEGDLKNKALAVMLDSNLQTDETLMCNAEESDTRIWLHVLHSASINKLVLSPDTDVYHIGKHIGLPIVAGTHLEVIVRLSPFRALEHRLLNLQALVAAFENDPDLAGVENMDIPQIMQMLFISTGCDFISFFNGLGKATFLDTLFEYSRFITSNSTDALGSLGNPTNSNGLLSFLRLVGCAYFKKHKSAFLPSFPTPMSLYNSTASNAASNGTLYIRHSDWLSLIGDRIWARIQYEEETIPSSDALSRHWMRAFWVLMVTIHIKCHHLPITSPENHGWKQPQHNTLTIDWDSENNVTKAKERVALTRKGCSCKTGCSTSRCKCKKSNFQCGPGCKCLGCMNLPIEAVGPRVWDSNSTDSDLEDEVDQLMVDIFGNPDDTYLNSDEEQ